MGLVVPVIGALVIQVLDLAAVALLMVERPTRPGAGLRIPALARDTSHTIARGVGLLRGSRVLLALVAVELFWGFGMVSEPG